MRRLISGIVIMMLILVMLPIEPVVFGYSPNYETGGINDWITVTSPSAVFDWSGYGDMWTSTYNQSYAPYVKVYKYYVEKGEEYTVYMKMPLSEGHMNIYVTGADPFSDAYNYDSNTMPGFVMYFQQPWAPRSNNIDVYRKNFKIASSSESDVLYFICHFENPGKSFEFMLKTPKDSDDDVANSTQNPYVPDRNGYTWGSLVGTPLFLETGSDFDVDAYEDEGSNSEDSYYTEETGITYTEDSYYGDEGVITTLSVADAPVLSLNQTYEYWTALDVNTLAMKEMYLDDWATAYQLYKITLEPGQKYTFDFLYNTFNNVNAFLIGENPMDLNAPFNNDASSNTIIAAFQEQPFLSLGYDEWYASRTQFTTASNSTGTTLYILVRAYYEGEPYKFMISRGHLSSAEETYNPYADSLNGYKWVTQWSTPLKLWK